MDMMGMIGYLAVYTVQEISAEDRRGVWLGGRYIYCWAGWLDVVAYMFD